jgi:3-oxoacyl-[acyl-carrier protein] reductase
MEKQQKIVLITGSTRGIGRAIAKKFADSGFAVVINSAKSESDGKKLEQAWKKQGVKCAYFKADVAKKNECEKLFSFIKQRFGKVDILVNNAGVYKTPEKISEDERNKMFQVKLNGVQYCSDLAIKLKTKSITNISSVYTTKPNFSSRLTSALQHGVENMTKNYATEYAGKVQVNCISPGYTETTLVKNNFTKKELREIIKKIPLKRLITPEEIAEVVYFLHTMPAITGQVLTIDGGYSLV